MQTKTKAIIVAVVAGLVGANLNANAPLGKAIWGPGPGGPAPEGGVLGLLMIYSVFEAVAFGIGVAFLAFGWPAVKRAAGSAAGAGAAFAAVAWLLVSWVPHSAMHMTNAHDNFARLALIEYIFHVTLIASGLVLLRFFVVALGARGQETTVAAPAKMGRATVKP